MELFFEGLYFVHDGFDFCTVGLGRLKYLFDCLFSDDGGHFPEEFFGVLSVFVYGEAEAEAEFCRVFKEGVAPRRTPAVVVDAPRGGGQVASVDGGAAGGVGYQSAVSEELGEEFEVGGFSAARAGSREFKERTQELDVFDCRGVEFGFVRLGEFEEVVPVFALLFAQGHLGLQDERTVRVFGLGFVYGAVVRAEPVAGAVFGRYLDGEVTAFEVGEFGFRVFECRGGLFEAFFVVDFGAYGRMGADEDAFAALDAE